MSKLTHINLVAAPTETEKGRERDYYPLGLCYLGAKLEAAGYRVEAFNLFNIPFEEVDLKRLANCDVIGLSILTWNRIASFKIVKEVKKINPNIKVIAGGIHCQTLYGQLLKNFPIDLIAIEEADGIVVDMIRSLEGSVDKKSIPGVAFLEEGNVVLNEGKVPLTQQQLDDLPMPQYEYFLNNESTTSFMITSRGCGFHCTFCSTTVYWGNVWRAHSVARTIREIEYVLSRFPKVTFIHFHDDQFCLDNKRVTDLCKEIVNRRLKFSWYCSTRVHPVGDEMLEWMKKAGCEYIIFGVESGSDQQIRNMNKRITTEQIRDTFARTRKHGIRPEVFLLLGIPGESEQTVADTCKLLDEIEVSAWEVAILRIFPNTKIYELAVSQGLVDDEYWLTDNPAPIYTYEHPYDRLKQMANTIVLHCAKRNKLGFVKFVAGHAMKHPLTLIKAGWERRYFQRFLGQK